jgi:hypothetical protein
MAALAEPFPVVNSVYAHIPGVVCFTEGPRALAADDGWVSIDLFRSRNRACLSEVEPTRADDVGTSRLGPQV